MENINVDMRDTSNFNTEIGNARTNKIQGNEITNEIQVRQIPHIWT